MSKFDPKPFQHVPPVAFSWWNAAECKLPGQGFLIATVFLKLNRGTLSETGNCRYYLTLEEAMKDYESAVFQLSTNKRRKRDDEVGSY